MGYLAEKVAYLKGLCDGLDINADSKEGKVILAIVEALGEITDEVEETILMQDEMQAQLDDVDEALADLEEDFYELDEDLDDLDELEDDIDEEWEEEYSFECPKCGDMVYVDLSLLDGDDGCIVCPNCHESIQLEFDIDSDEE